MKKAFLLLITLLWASLCFGQGGPFPYPLNGDAPGFISLGKHNADAVIGGTAPVYGSDGSVLTKAVNTLRMSSLYLDGAWSPAHWAWFRPAITNDGEGEMDTQWGGTGTISDTGTILPGYQWYELTDDSAAAAQSVQHTVVIPTDNQTHASSILVEKTTGALSQYPSIEVHYRNGSDQYLQAVFDTTTGAISNGTYFSIYDLGACWKVDIIGANTGANTVMFFRIGPAWRTSFSYGSGVASLTGSVKVAAPQFCQNQSFAPPIPIITTDTPITTVSEAGGTGPVGVYWTIPQRALDAFAPDGAFTIVFDAYWPAVAGAGSVHVGVLSPTNSKYQGIYQTSSGALIGRDSADNLVTGNRSSGAGYVDRIVYSASGSTQRMSTYRGQTAEWVTNTSTYSGSLTTTGGLMYAAFGSDIPMAIKLPIKIYSYDVGTNYTRFTP